MRFKTIEIDGNTYSVRFTYNTMAELEERLGYGIGQLFTRDMGFAAARLLLYAGLRAKHKSITLERAGELVQSFCESGKKMTDLIGFLYDTMKFCGVVQEVDESKKDAEEGSENPPSPAPSEN